MAVRLSLLVSYIFFSALVVTALGASFSETSCDKKKEGELRTIIGGLVGLPEAEIKNRLDLADDLSVRSHSKTWASAITRSAFQAIPWGTTSNPKANAFRFSYPYGESSGGYRTAPLLKRNQFLRTQEARARVVSNWAYAYMKQLSGQIAGYNDLFPVNILNDQGCEQLFHATHAELKLLTRMMRLDGLQVGQTVLMAVSRHMCNYCAPIVAHLARNGRRRIVVITPRKSSRSKSSLAQPEFVIFEADGSYTRYSRESAASNGDFGCKKFAFEGTLPAGIDTYRAPDPDFEVRQLALSPSKDIHGTEKQLLIGNNSTKQIVLECPDGNRGPGNECFSFIREDLPKSVDCPRPMTMTGVHGTFGPASANFPTIVMKSIGSYCDVTEKQDAMGYSGSIPFDFQCPADYQFTGFFGNFGDFVDSVGIICRNIFDGSEWRSASAGGDGGISEEKECPSGSAGMQIRLWLGELAIDGLGACCR